MLRRFRKLIRLSWREWGIFIQAIICLPAVDLLIRTRGVKHCIEWFERAGPARDAQFSMKEAQSLARMVHVAGRFLPWPTRCLPQSIWIHRCLLQRGLQSRIRFGVTSLTSSLLSAHAWVELDGIPLDEQPGLQVGPVPFN
jgi:hypothetical protein